MTEKLLTGTFSIKQTNTQANFLNPKFQASYRLLLLYSPVCVGPSWKPRNRFSHVQAKIFMYTEITICSHCILSICNINLFSVLVLRAGFAF